MADNTSSSKHITRLDFDVTPAIMDLQSLEILFDGSMKKLEKMAMQGVEKVNKELARMATNFSSQYAKQGEFLVKQARQQKEQFDKELAELLHLRKTGQLDAQQFLKQSESYRIENFNALFKKEQIQLQNAVVKAENEQRKILDEKRKIEKSITEEKRRQFQEANKISNQNLKAWKEEMKMLRGESGQSAIQNIVPVAASSQKKEFNLLTSEIQRRVSWFATGASFYGLINSANEAKDTIKEVEYGMNEIARVMEDSAFIFKDYRDELLQLGIDYGQTFENVQDISLRWAQAGYNVNDSLSLTETSLLALNSAELNAQNATESLIGIMAQWELTASELPLVLDKINKTGDEFTVTSQDLVDGLLRSSGAARIMGMSLDQTISLLTVMREASGRTGAEVGNALNSILSYVQRPKSIDILEGLGIQVFSDTAKTQFRNVMDIFQDIASQWGNLSSEIQDGFVKAADDAGLYNEELAEAIGTQEEWNDLQQRDISQAAAGVYRRNYFIGMIQRLSEAQEVLNAMTDASGYSMQENARTMQTLEKQYQSTMAAAQQLAVTIGDEGLEDVLRGLNNFGSEGLQGITALIKEIGFLPPAIATAMASLVLFRKEMQLFKYDQETGLGINVQAVSKFKTALIDIRKIYLEQKSLLAYEGIQSPTFWQKATIGANAFRAKLTEINVGMKLLSFTGKALGLALNVAFNVAAGLAIGLAVDWIFKMVNAQKEAANQAKMTADQFKQEQKALQDLRTSYEGIARSGNLTEESKKQLKRIQDQLLKTYDLEAEKLDLVNGKYVEQIKIIDEAIAKKAKEQMAATGARADQAKKSLEKVDKSSIYISDSDSISQAIDGLNNAYLRVTKGELGNISYWLDIKDSLTGRRDTLQDIINTLQKIPNKSKDVIETINALSDEFNNLDTKVKENKNTLEDYLEQKNIADFYDAFRSEISEANNIMAEMYKTKDVESYSQKLDSLKKSMQDASNNQKRLADFSPFIEELFSKAASGAQETSDGLSNLGANTSQASEELKNLTSDISTLNQTLDALNQGNKLSADQVYDLIDKYPKLSNSIIQVGDSYKIETSAIEALRKEKIKEQEIALDAEAQKTKEVIKETLSRINAYGLEVEAIKDLKTANSAWSGLGLINSTMSFYEYSRTGLNRMYPTEEEYNQAVAAGNQILALGELYESIEQKKNLLNSSYFGVSNADKKSSSNSSSKIKNETNTALQNALNLLEHQKRMNKISTEQELERLKQIKSMHVKTAEERMDMEERIYEVEQTLIDERFQTSIDWIEKKKSFNELSTQEEIAAWKRVRDNQKNNADAVKEATLNIYNLQKQLREEDMDYYKDYISDQKDLLDELHDKKVELIEKEAEEKKKVLEKAIKDIEKEKDALEKAEDDRDHAKTMDDLRKELAYWQVRTSEEAREKVVEISKKIAEEQHDYEVEQQKQALDSKKKAAQDEMTAIEEAAEKEKAKWKEVYSQIEKAFSAHNQDVISMASVTSKRAFQEWNDNYLIPLRNALSTGDLTRAGSISSGLSKSISNIPSHDWGMSDADYNKFIDNGKRWELLQGSRSIEEMNRLSQDNNNLRLKYSRNPSLGEYPKFHSGAETLSYGFAMFKPGELVFPPHLSTSLKELISILSSGGQKSIINNKHEREIKIGTLLNIEKNVMEDDVDSTILSRELKRAVLSLGS